MPTGSPGSSPATSTISRVVLLHNPRSGRGRSQEAISELRRELSRAGYKLDEHIADASLTTDVLTAALAQAHALIVGGGDGSISHAIPAIVAAQRPVYHYPLGTENLFARHFGMLDSPAALINSLGTGRTTSIDIAAAGTRPFVLMASIGFDAAVVARVAAARTAGVHRLHYVRHTIAEFATHTPSPLTVEIDGRTIVERESGLLFIANSPHYAARLNPCAKAMINDGLLDVLFLPYRSRARLLAWASSVMARRHLRAPEARASAARTVRIQSHGRPLFIQMDGEHIPPDPLNADRLECSIVPRQLLVLLPA